MAPGDLQEVLSVLRRPAMSAETAGNRMVGRGAADDAAVYRISDGLALGETVEFFPPVVDDAWTWGAAAAANAASGRFAMGGAAGVRGARGGPTHTPLRPFPATGERWSPSRAGDRPGTPPGGVPAPPRGRAPRRVSPGEG